MTSATADQSRRHADRNPRKAARLAAVQALYQMELTGSDAEAVSQEFVEHRFGHEFDPKPDEDFFRAVVVGVPHHQSEIDRAIGLCLAADWKLARIDSILRAILRAGTYELIAQRDVPARAVIDEYLDIAHAFFDGELPAFVNAVLDKLAHRKRAAEFNDTASGDELEF